MFNIPEEIVMSESIAIAMSIIKGKFEQWQVFSNKLKNEYRNEYAKSRKDVGLHERTFLQRTPDGDFVIVTLEGNDPLGSFGKIFQAQDDYTKWFVEQVKELHGFDLSSPMEHPPSELIVDTNNL
jgi:hypothetical protein